MRNGEYELVVAPAMYPGKKYRGRYAYEHHVAYWLARGVVPGPTQTLHHRNGNKRDNRVQNLQLLERSEHVRHHIKRPKVVSVTCGWCRKSFRLFERVLRARLKQSRSGKVFCCASHSVTHQHTRQR